MSQYIIGDLNWQAHSLCWAHAELLVHKLQPMCDTHRRAVDIKRSLISRFYADLKAYQRDLNPRVARSLQVRLDRVFTKQTGYVMLDQQLARLHKLKADLLRSRQRSEIPLRKNGSENDIRTFVTDRKISGSTVSETGKAARHIKVGLLKS